MIKFIYVFSSTMLVISLITFIYISLPSANSIFYPAKEVISVKEKFIDLSCVQGSDCQIKDIGNQCGYYPMCVNKNFIPNPPELDSMICGFPSINGCQCIENKCQGFLK